jgi:hypothetical protein
MKLKSCPDPLNMTLWKENQSHIKLLSLPSNYLGKEINYSHIKLLSVPSNLASGLASHRFKQGNSWIESQKQIEFNYSKHPKKIQIKTPLICDLQSSTNRILIEMPMQVICKLLTSHYMMRPWAVH